MPGAMTFHDNLSTTLGMGVCFCFAEEAAPWMQLALLPRRLVFGCAKGSFHLSHKLTHDLSSVRTRKLAGRHILAALRKPFDPSS